ncbi:hypothetical protein NP233_g12008 [Leucocoprinus birnbaumii]|uniref:Uncharacterized protein n=1 Tax=Leucocoprinus birnbaumii TaxID=56174 RepID=A0AAD5YQE7_9AGAR|nr:hypothetical protein NP233_g12008 [Leucocoprinus birnbaumii]
MYIPTRNEQRLDVLRHVVEIRTNEDIPEAGPRIAPHATDYLRETAEPTCQPPNPAKPISKSTTAEQKLWHHNGVDAERAGGGICSMCLSARGDVGPVMDDVGEAELAGLAEGDDIRGRQEQGMMGEEQMS